MAYDLVQKYDVIFLPTFETKKMSKKQGRRIRRRTTREMLSLGHYEFKLRIKWYAKKYGKLFDTFETKEKMVVNGVEGFMKLL